MTDPIIREVTGPARLADAVDLLRSGRVEEYYRLLRAERASAPAAPGMVPAVHRRVDWAG